MYHRTCWWCLPDQSTLGRSAWQRRFEMNRQSCSRHFSKVIQIRTQRNSSFVHVTSLDERTDWDWASSNPRLFVFVTHVHDSSFSKSSFLLSTDWFCFHILWNNLYVFMVWPFGHRLCMWRSSFSYVHKLRGNHKPWFALQQWNRGLTLESEAQKSTYMNEIDVRKPLVGGIYFTKK